MKSLVLGRSSLLSQVVEFDTAAQVGISAPDFAGVEANSAVFSGPARLYIASSEFLGLRQRRAAFALAEVSLATQSFDGKSSSIAVFGEAQVSIGALAFQGVGDAAQAFDLATVSLGAQSFTGLKSGKATFGLASISLGVPQFVGFEQGVSGFDLASIGLTALEFSGLKSRVADFDLATISIAGQSFTGVEDGISAFDLASVSITALPFQGLASKIGEFTAPGSISISAPAFVGVEPAPSITISNVVWTPASGGNQGSLAFKVTDSDESVTEHDLTAAFGDDGLDVTPAQLLAQSGGTQVNQFGDRTQIPAGTPFSGSVTGFDTDANGSTRLAFNVFRRAETGVSSVVIVVDVSAAPGIDYTPATGFSDDFTAYADGAALSAQANFTKVSGNGSLVVTDVGDTVSLAAADTVERLTINATDPGSDDVYLEVDFTMNVLPNINPTRIQVFIAGFEFRVALRGSSTIRGDGTPQIAGGSYTPVAGARRTLRCEKRAGAGELELFIDGNSESLATGLTFVAGARVFDFAVEISDQDAIADLEIHEIRTEAI